MYISKIEIQSFGPISSLNLEPRLKEDGTPVPVLIVGTNGSGKSLVLAAALDALVEARSQCFESLPETDKGKSIRYSMQNYIHSQEGHSHVRITLKLTENAITFDEAVRRQSLEDFLAQAADGLKQAVANSERFADAGFFRSMKVANNQKEEVRKTLFLYFPAFRYEWPVWLAEKARPKMPMKRKWLGDAPYDAVRLSSLEEMQNWILDIIMDRELYEKVIVPLPVAIKNGQQNIFQVFAGYDGPNSKLTQLVNTILSLIQKARNPSVVSSRIGIAPKGNRSIAVYSTREGSQEEVVAHELGQLSSGEMILLSLAVDIVRAAEATKGQPPDDLAQIEGVVLIDEADLHLHITFQKDVFPSLLKMFPKIQFILTTHSPFLVLGVAEGGDVDIIRMPFGTTIQPDEFDEFEEAYNVFVEKNSQFRDRYIEIRDKLNNRGSPLVVTEGKTDWRHFKIALRRLVAEGKFEPFEFEFMEYGDEIEMGDAALYEMCRSRAKLNGERLVVFVFDRDNPKVLKDVVTEAGEAKHWGNNVFSCAIPVPEHRKEYKNICVELLYTDKDLATVEPDSSKRLWFDNEVDKVIEGLRGAAKYVVRDEPIMEKENDKKPYDENVANLVNKEGVAVALSKFAFVENVVGNDEISKEFDFSGFTPLFEQLRNICEADKAVGQNE